MASPPRRDHTGEYLVMLAALPKTNCQNIGVLLLDVDSDQLYCRFRRDFAEFAGAEADWFKEMPDYILEMAKQLGAQKCVEWLETTLSNTLRISARRHVRIADRAATTVDNLYAKLIRPNILPFRTHLPQYSLEAAAGKFGKQMSVEPEGWVEVRAEIPLSEDMFVIHVTGHSMEPLIPDASLCAFRSDTGTPWDGKVLLFERYGESGGNRYTVKLCHLCNTVDSNQQSDDAWLHHRVTLESINPDYRSWEVASTEKIKALGEFLFVVE
jgi:Peptidase S24-like